MLSQLVNKIKIFASKKPLTIKRKEEEIDFDLLNKLSIYHKETDFSIDDITWNDLDLQKVFVAINHTTTTTGEETLYYWLHHPINDKELLWERAKHIEDLGKDNNALEKLRIAMSKVKFIRFDYREIINNEFHSNWLLLGLFNGLALLSLIGLIYSVITWSHILIPTVIVMINILIHFRYMKKVGAQIQVLTYVVGLLSKSRTISLIIQDSYPELSEELYNLFLRLKKIYSRSNIIFKLDGVDLFADYFNILFLVKERNYLFVAKQVEKYKDELNRLYEVFGELDALASIAVYRKELDYYCLPQFNDNCENMIVDGIYHPLINHPTANDIQTSTSIAITGSNMSGKSTFLRTIGINTLFAQSIMTCLSKTYSSGFFRLLTSINLSDNITTSKSYFLMEAEAIKRMVESINCNFYSLILIDEIFKGTNPTERIAASIEILNLLASEKTLTFVATHDLQILPLLKGYDYYYFTENITDQGMDFDYKMYKGIAPTRNAIKILNYLKYPSSLLNKIEARLKTIEHL